MGILEEIRENTISTNWFMKNEEWFCFSDGTLYTQDKTKTGPDSIVAIDDKYKRDTVLSYYKSKN